MPELSVKRLAWSSIGEKAIAFYPYPGELRFPRNNREYFLSRELAARGWNVTWIRPTSEGDRQFELEWPVLRVADLDLRGHRFFYPIYLALRLWMAGIDVLWLSGWTIRNLQKLHWTVRFARAFDIRVVYDPIDPICEYEATRRDDDDPEPLRHCADRARRVYSACDLVTCVTPEIRDLLEEHGAPSDRLRVARWGTDAERFDPERIECDFKERLGLEPDTFLVGWLGTMTPFKGLEDIIVPLAEASGEVRSDIHYVVAGKGPLRPKLKEWAAGNSEVSISVLSEIPYDEAPNFTGSLDAYVVPTEPRTSYAESICPVKCYDSLAMGTPLITTRTPATRCLSEFSNLVALVEYDVKAFLREVMSVYSSERTTSPAREAVEKKYSHQAVSVSIADAIERMVSA